MTILGIESSCDDAAAAVVLNGELRSSIVSSQDIHEKHGGVVPEIASRAHQRLIVPVVEAAICEAGILRADIDAVAVTRGPGLAGSLLVGLSFGKAVAFAYDIPLIGINHLDGHIYSVFLGKSRPAYPFLCLIVSGGHTQLVSIEGAFHHTLLGRTRDDAAGEAFDKVAKLLDMGYPGGPRIDRLARDGDPDFRNFPRAELEGYDYSFSGLKTSVLYYLNEFDERQRQMLLNEHLGDICASFQAAVTDVLVESIIRAVRHTGIREVAITGGVAANSELRRKAEDAARKEGFALYVPPLKYCMDNAAMIAIAGYLKLKAGKTDPLTLTVDPALNPY